MKWRLSPAFMDFALDFRLRWPYMHDSGLREILNLGTSSKHYSAYY